MRAQLTNRDRSLLLYVLCPAALLAIAAGFASPLTGALVEARQTLREAEADLVTMENAIARHEDIAREHTQVQAAAAQLRSRVHGSSPDAVLALQAMIAEAGLSRVTVRVGEAEVQRGDLQKDAPVAVPIEVVAAGSYDQLVVFLERWAEGNVPLKLVGLQVKRQAEAAQLEIAMDLKAFAASAPPRARP